MGTLFEGLFERLKKSVYETLESNFYNELTYSTSFSRNYGRNGGGIVQDSLISLEEITDIYEIVLKFCGKYDHKAYRYIKELKTVDKMMLLYNRKKLIFKIKDNIIIINFLYRTTTYGNFLLEITIIGLQSKRLFEILNLYIDKKIRKNKFKSNTIYNVDNSGVIVPMSNNMIYYTRNIISPNLLMIEKEIQKFFKNSELYKRYNKNYIFTLFLYGSPGTGKTTIVKNIASKFNIPILTITNETSINSFIKRTLPEMKNDKYYIVLFDDIDLILKDRSNPEEEEYKISEKKLYFLLQYLDGIVPYENIINILTTNYPELIDERLKRPGRIDQMIKIDNLSYDYAIKLCEKFGVKGEDAKKMLDSYTKEYNLDTTKDFIFNPATIENYILSKMEE